MKNLTIIFYIVFAALLTNTARAHMPVGGEIAYVHLGDSTYQVIFKLYQNCAAASTPSTFDLCVRNSCNNTVLSRTLKMLNIGANGTLINPFCPNATTSCNNTASTNIAYKVYFYSDTVQLPSRCNFWTFSVNAGQRHLVTNLLGTPKDMYIEARLNNTVTHKNNSPYYSVLPAYVGEQGIPFQQKVGALDADGDSLYTYLIQPLTSSTTCGDTGKPVLYNAAVPPYNQANNPFQTNNTYSQNRSTADFYCTLVLHGHATLAFRTDEYRNGVLIGSVMREMLVQVVNPGPAKQTKTVLTCSTPNIGGSINNTIYACVDEKIEMCYAIVSPGSKLFVSDDIIPNLPGASAVYLNQGTDSVHVKLTWIPGLQQAGKQFTMTHTIVDSTCNPGLVVRTSTQSLNFQVWGIISAGNDTTICTGNCATLKALGGADYRWTILPGGTSNSLNDTTKAETIACPIATTTYVVRSTTNEYCQYFTEDTVTVFVNTSVANPAVTITVSPSQNVWQSLNVTFTATGSGCTTPYYQWVKNGQDIKGATASSWSTTTLKDQDAISCRLTCGDTCSSPRDTGSNIITMNVATSVNDVKENSPSLYPNPNNGTFTLQLNEHKSYHIEIIDMLGQIVHKKEIEETTTFTLPNLAQGIYTIKMHDNFATYSLKFTKL